MSLREKKKWIKDLHVRPQTVKFSAENLGRRFTTLNLTIILGMTPKAQGRKEKKLRLHQNKNFSASEYTIKGVKRQVTEQNKKALAFLS